MTWLWNTGYISLVVPSLPILLGLWWLPITNWALAGRKVGTEDKELPFRDMAQQFHTSLGVPVTFRFKSYDQSNSKDKTIAPMWMLLFNCSVVSDSLQSCRLQYARLPCPSPYPEFAHIHVHWVGDAIQTSHSLSSPSPSALNLSQHQGLFQLSALPICHQVAKVVKLQVHISPSNDYSRLISFRTDWFDLLAVQGTLESSPAPQFKSINSSVLSLLYGLTLTSVQDWTKNYSQLVARHCECYIYTCVLTFNWRCIRKFISDRAGSKLSKARVLDLQNLMPDALRWSWYKSNRNKVHSKRNALESSWNHPHAVCGKTVFHEKGPWCQKACGPPL